MKWNRTLAGTLYACGLLSVLLGLEEISRAQTCTAVEFPSGTCKPAHAGEPFQNGSGSYCEWVSNQCQATASSDCVDRWGFAYPGKCFVEALGTSPTHTCFEQALLTFVNVSWYTASCEQHNGECNCVWEASITSQPMQVCDCYDVENE